MIDYLSSHTKCLYIWTDGFRFAQPFNLYFEMHSPKLKSAEFFLKKVSKFENTIETLRRYKRQGKANRIFCNSGFRFIEILYLFSSSLKIFRKELNCLRNFCSKRKQKTIDSFLLLKSNICHDSFFFNFVQMR